jgi:glutathione S-transferase
MDGLRHGFERLVSAHVAFPLTSEPSIAILCVEAARSGCPLGGDNVGSDRSTFVAQLKILDGHIAGRDWFALDHFTIADIALGSIVKRCLEFPIERPPYPELTRWQAAIDARPAFAVAVGTKPSALSPAA